MEEMSGVDHTALVNAIATREGNVRQLRHRFGLTKADLVAFVESNKEAIELAREALGLKEGTENGAVTPTDLKQLWISKKLDRLTRYQKVADHLYELIMEGHLIGTENATALREFRSYSLAAANELGQLLHRGSGESSEEDSASYDIPGVNLDTMR